MSWRKINSLKELEPNLPVMITNVKTGEVRHEVCNYRKDRGVVLLCGAGGEVRFKDWTWEEDDMSHQIQWAAYDGKVIWGIGPTPERAMEDGKNWVTLWEMANPDQPMVPPLQVMRISHRLRLATHHMGGCGVKFEAVPYPEVPGESILVLKTRRSQHS